MNRNALKINKTLLAALLGSGCIAMAPQAAHAGPTIQFGDEGSMTFTYAVQGWYQSRDFSAANTKAENDFFLRRNRLSLSGQFNDYVGYYFQVEGGGFPGANNDLFVRDAYVTIDYKDELRFIIGEFKNTFSRENLEACLEPLTLDRSEILAYTPFGGTRDKGVAVWGNLFDAKLQYRAMISEGRDDIATPEDNMRVTARVHYSFLDPEYNYGYLGTYLGTQKVFTIGAAYDYQPNVVYADYLMRNDPKDYKAWTLDAFFEYPTASGVYTASAASFKYDSGDVTNATPDANYPINGDLKGYYAKVGYMLPNKVGMGRLQFFARRDKADYGVKTGNAEYYDRSIDSLGANYYINGQNLKLTVEYSDIDFDTPHPLHAQLQDQKLLTLGLQFVF